MIIYNHITLIFQVCQINIEKMFGINHEIWFKVILVDHASIMEEKRIIPGKQISE